MNLFDKVKCKGFYKPYKDGRWLYLDKKTLTADAMDNNLADGNNDGTVEKNVEYIEKTYFKHVDKDFTGVIVGYKDIVIKGYLDAVYQDECDVGVGVIPEAFYVSKRAKEIAKRAGCRNVATVHVYRKTFASREYQRTKDILYVSHRLGHANTAVTEKYYICDDIAADRKMANVA